MQAERSYKSKSRDEEKKSKLKLADLPRLSPDRALIAHQAALDRGADCAHCPLFGLRQGPIPDEINPGSQVTIIGEGPGQNEVDRGVPFIGKSGREVFRALADGGLARTDTSVLNAINCRPPEDYKAFEQRLRTQFRLAIAKWEEDKVQAEKDGQEFVTSKPIEEKTPAECCFPRLQKSIEEASSPVVLALGNAALKAVANHWDVPFGTARKAKVGQVRIASLKKQLGAPLTLPDGRILVSTYHPAFAMRKGSRHYAHVIRAHISRAAEIARRGYIDWQEPDYILNPNVDTIEAVLKRMKAQGNGTISLDIETDKGRRRDKKFDPFTCRIRCIGLGTTISVPDASSGTSKDEELLICVPIRHMSGDEWWSTTEEKRRVIQAVVDLIDDPSIALLGHNLAFDTGVLLRFSLLSHRALSWSDSMMAHHDTSDNDLPHDLGFVTSRYFETPSWKSSADEKFYDHITDTDLHAYNVKDVLTCMRLWPVIMDEVRRCGTTKQFDLDTKIMPIARDMGELGLFIDERMRGELSTKMNGEAFTRLVKLKKLVDNQNFNPNSPPQVRRFLFGKKKRTPVINTKQRDWEEGEDPSTNSKALVKLTKQQGCDVETVSFIDTLLEYRGYRKLAGTYIDNLPAEEVNWSSYVNEGWLKEDPGIAPSLIGKTFRKYKKREKKALGTELEGEWVDTEVLPVRSALSRLHTTYKWHVIPSGRCSTAPAIQNWPERPHNMRALAIAPPGHKIVGADMDQVELRLYAAIAQDKLLLKAFQEGLDAHAWNAASLFAKKFKMTIEQCYTYISSLEKDEKKKLRNIAKTFVYLECLPGDSLILTDRGEVRLDEVSITDRVWDGVEWVAHEGLIYRGEKEVITYDGVTATPNHKVWLEDGSTTTLGEAAKQRRVLVRTGTGGQPLWFLDYDVRNLERTRTQKGVRSLQMRRRESDLSRQSSSGEVFSMQRMLNDSNRHPSMAPWSSFVHETTMHQHETSELVGLWRTWNSVPLRIDSLWRRLDSKESQPAQGFGIGSHRQRWALRARQYSLGHTLRQRHEQDEHSNATRLEVHRRSMAFHAQGHLQISSGGTNSLRNHRACKVVHKERAPTLAWSSTKVKVYDLLNAGPRRRFTANGKLVSNCYGGEAEKLADFMLNARDKATGELMFPDITEVDVEGWHHQWHEKHPETRLWQRVCVDVARREGYTASPIGSYRKRFFMGGANKQGATFNTVVQGSAAEIANRALLEIAEKIPYQCWSPFTGLCFQVHDYLGLICPDEKAEYAKKVIEKAINCAVFGIDITATGKISDRWSDQ